MKKCVIVGAGDFFSLRNPIENDTYVIAADGGFDYLKRESIKPNLVIGDMDSTGFDIIDANAIVLPCQKDDTDMLAAIRQGLDKGYRYFEMYGALGGRLDHTIANIQCLLFLKNNGAHGIIYGKEDSLQLIRNEKIDFDEYKRGYISVFAYGGEAKGVTEKGLMYEVADVTLIPSIPIGVSNEFIGKKAYVEVKEGNLLIHIQKDIERTGAK